MSSLIKNVSTTNDKLGQSKEEYISTAMTEAQNIWDKLIKIVRANPDFVKMPDNDKIGMFMKDHKEFQNEFPIVCRYMICMGQYRPNAFKRYLNKCKNATVAPPEKREKGYMQEQWIDRQADYVRYLWEEYQKRDHKKFTTREAMQVWRQARDSLSAEFKGFKEAHTKAESKIKTEEKENNRELAKELVDRIKLGKQNLSPKELENLLHMARANAYRQRKTKLMKQIKDDVKTIRPVRVAYGRVKEEKNNFGTASSFKN